MSISLLRRLSLALGFSLAASNALAENWPQPDWQSQPRIESPALAELEQYAFPKRDDVERTGVRTDALLVIRDGQIVYERYAEPTTARTAHLTWSMGMLFLLPPVFALGG